MFVGGTNFDDWASRETTTTYDFYASIRENGGVDEKYRRIKGIAAMLKEHGKRMARSEKEHIQVIISDSLVEVAMRRSEDGGRFFFVRTEDRKTAHSGNIRVSEANGFQFSFDFALEPFGSMVYYLPAGANTGKWYPELPDPMVRPVDLPAAIEITRIEKQVESTAPRWKNLKKGESVEKYGVFDRHFIHYRVKVPAGKIFSVGRIGENVANRSKADGILAMVNGKLLSPLSEDKESISFQMPDGAKEVILLFENRGLHHHTNLEIEKHWKNGIKWVKIEDKKLPLQFASFEKELGRSYSKPEFYTSKGWQQVDLPQQNDLLENEMLIWSRFTFELPEKTNNIWVPWKLLLEATGNGFTYLNGHCIGRFWEIGPQKEFFLPECWLNIGNGKPNIISLSLRPNQKGADIKSATIVPDNEFAEFR